ncbi:endonuclease [Candidatus Berkelbacteria bacterium]|nr:endonuclease [Candidatus Berkelbacteria bacterium]
MESKIIFGLVIGLIILIWLYVRAIKAIFGLKFSKRSLSSRYGKTVEQFLPFLKDLPFEPDNFRFLGNPIDGVAFEEDKIILVEFKTADSKLSQRQEEIKDLVNRKKVEFREIRLD